MFKQRKNKIKSWKKIVVKALISRIYKSVDTSCTYNWCNTVSEHPENFNAGFCLEKSNTGKNLWEVLYLLPYTWNTSEKPWESRQYVDERKGSWDVLLLLKM